MGNKKQRKVIKVSLELWETLHEIKLKNHSKSIDETINYLISEYFGNNPKSLKFKNKVEKTESVVQYEYKE